MMVNPFLLLLLLLLLVLFLFLFLFLFLLLFLLLLSAAMGQTIRHIVLTLQTDQRRMEPGGADEWGLVWSGPFNRPMDHAQPMPRPAIASINLLQAPEDPRSWSSCHHRQGRPAIFFWGGSCSSQDHDLPVCPSGARINLQASEWMCDLPGIQQVAKNLFWESFCPQPPERPVEAENHR
jgi:hypothetical protein